MINQQYINQPIQSHVGKSLLTYMDLDMQYI